MNGVRNLSDEPTSRRADEPVARRAALTPFLSCCVIIKDEAANLPDLFASAQSIVDEWVVVDTGSADASAAIARAHGARVFDFVWADSFAEARNFALGHCTGSWIIVLDADDRLLDADSLPAFLHRVLSAGDLENPETSTFDVGLLPVESPLSSLPGAAFDRGFQPRLFQRKHDVRYRFAIHELPIIDHLRRGIAPGRILHTGYKSEALRHQKAERVLRLLPRVEDEVYRLYHECRALSTLGRHREFCIAAARFRDIGGRIPADIRTRLATMLVAKGEAGAAIRLLTEGLQDDPMHPDLYLALWFAAGVGYVDRCERVLEGQWWEGAPVATLAHLDSVDKAIFASGLIERPLRASFAELRTHQSAGPRAPVPGHGDQPTNEGKTTCESATARP